jgi:hypothetical protein
MEAPPRSPARNRYPIAQSGQARPAMTPCVILETGRKSFASNPPQGEETKRYSCR